MSDIRVGDWAQTFSGRRYWPLDPRVDEIHIEDIAHSASMLCRFLGHCKRFYSVAEHSVYVSYFVPPEDALCALLHDATEPFLVDVPRPLKPYLTGYKALEDQWWLKVAERFGLPAEMPQSVKEADIAVLLAERDQIMNPCEVAWDLPGEPADVMTRGSCLTMLR